jgi:HEAT repeat protein
VTTSMTPNNPDVHILIKELDSPDKEKRQQARAALLSMGSYAAPALIKALGTKNERIRLAAIKLLAYVREPLSTDALVKALSDDLFEIRWAASEALILKEQSALAPLFNALVKHFDSIWLREGASHILNSLNKKGLLDPPALKVLQAIQGPSPEIKVPWAASQALETANKLIIGQ